MNQFRFEAEIVRVIPIPAEIVRERVYGGVRVGAEWPTEIIDVDVPEVRVGIEVTGDVDWRDAPAYVELFFHDVFLLMNLAMPGSFGGTVTISGGELKARELTFSTRVFEYAAPLERLPLADVIAWYDGLRLGTQQFATSRDATALFQLLHLARRDEEEEESILRLASAAKALVGKSESLKRLFELRDAIATHRTTVIHPMHDDSLDPRIEDATRELVEVADHAANVVITALQQRVRRRAPSSGRRPPRVSSSSVRMRRTG